MQKYLDLTKYRWEEVQRCLSSLTGFSLLIYDPAKHKPCTPITDENIFCHLVHQTERASLCQTTLAQQVDLAVQTQEISFSKCQANLNYFVIPIRVSNEINYTIVGGNTYFAFDEFSDFREKAPRWGIAPAALASSANKIQFGTPEILQEAARTLQTIGTALLENIYHRNHY